MHTACTEARKWLGATSPNPPVGAVALNKYGEVMAVAAHKRAGTAHAETQVIATCGDTKIDTLVVTLAPCNHQGRTPPCTEAIIRAGIKHVVIGTTDPNTHVKGGGIERLQQAGIEIINHVNEDECRGLIHAFAYHARTGKPWITVKRAFNVDGSMIPEVGQKTFTLPESLRLAHQLRKKADAIITGSGTVLADNPLFTVRHVADFPDKKRWLGILDRRGRVPETYLHDAAARGFMPVIYHDNNEAVRDLTAKGAQDILVESGPALSQTFLDSGLWVMRVDIHQDNPDRVVTSFNPTESVAFDVQHMLPE